MSFGESQEAFLRINESCAGIRQKRSVARFRLNSDKLFYREASMVEPIESGTPYKEKFLIAYQAGIYY